MEVKSLCVLVILLLLIRLLFLIKELNRNDKKMVKKAKNDYLKSYKEINKRKE